MEIKSFATYVSESKIKTFTFWVDKHDAKESEKIMKRLGASFKNAKNEKDHDGMKVWELKAISQEVELIQHELAQKDINSWVDGKRNK